MVAIELAIALSVGMGMVVLSLGGAAWIIGGVVGGGIVFSVLKRQPDQSLQPNRTARKVGQVIIGLAIGLSLKHEQLDTIASHLFVFMGLPLCLMLGGALVGIFYAWLEKTDLFTALLATTPGNIGVMATIAADYSGNTPLVALIQLMRFTSVIFAMPMIANVMIANATIHVTTNQIAHGISNHLPNHISHVIHNNDLVTDAITAHSSNQAFSEFIQQLVDVSPSCLLIASLMLAIASLAAYLGDKLKIPIAAFLGAIAVGLVLDNLSFLFPNLSSTDLHLPLGFSIVGQALLGITIGEYWGINPPLQLATIARATIPVSLIFMIALGTAAVIHQLTAWQWLTCLLIASPGGSPEMIWIALTLHQDTEIITAGHVIRLLTINLTLPILVSLASYLQPNPGKGSASGE
jgi:membrane AbrB-like protein